jgi:hypothetical protein
VQSLAGENGAVGRCLAPERGPDRTGRRGPPRARSRGLDLGGDRPGRFGTLTALLESARDALLKDTATRRAAALLARERQELTELAEG